MTSLRLIFFPFSIIYWIITTIRNTFYAIGLFKSTPFSIPIINVGNLSLGGTGKTPHVEYLIRLLKTDRRIATLSRGYGRKEHGFKIADDHTTAKVIGDEPMQYHSKFGSEITVAVEANRVLGVMDICKEEPDTDLILLDDAFQHRAIKPGLNIMITAYDRPFYTDWIVPVGNLRESRAGKNRADIIIVSKCPQLDSTEKAQIVKMIRPGASQEVYFSRIIYNHVISMNDSENWDELKDRNLILVTGIANEQPLLNYLSKRNTILHHQKFRDHHQFKESDIETVHNIFDKFVRENPVIITTEKDAMRIMEPSLKSKIQGKPWYYQEIRVEIDEKEKFDQRILNYVKENN